MQQIIRDKPDGLGTFASEFHVFLLQRDFNSHDLKWSFFIQARVSSIQRRKNVCEINCIHYGVKFVNGVNVLIRKLVYHLNYSRHINAELIMS